MNNTNYNFKLPESLIANEPTGPRDSSRLFVYSTKTDEIMVDVFTNLEKYLPQNSLMVFNNTKVVPSSIELTKMIGGKVRVLFLFNKWKRDLTIKGVAENIYVGDILFIDHQKLVQVESKSEDEFTFKILVPVVDFLRIIDKRGHIALPKNINTTMSEELARSRYQAIFASKDSSIVSPTASLHFTDGVLKSLETKGIDKTFVTLHVGHVDFSDYDSTAFEKKSLHNEPISLSKESSLKINKAKAGNMHIVAVGSTALRLLESTADSILKGEEFEGESSNFIEEPYHFKIADTLITNFHLPNTPLLLLADAFLKDKKAKRNLIDLYEIAIKNKFKFHSFGDAMLIV